MVAATRSAPGERRRMGRDAITTRARTTSARRGADEIPRGQRAALLAHTLDRAVLGGDHRADVARVRGIAERDVGRVAGVEAAHQIVEEVLPVEERAVSAAL